MDDLVKQFDDSDRKDRRRELEPETIPDFYNRDQEDKLFSKVNEEEILFE